jgi:hypothetical protein
MKKCVILKNSLVFNFVKASFYQNDVLFDYTILSKCQDLCFFWGYVQMYSGRHLVNPNRHTKPRVYLIDTGNEGRARDSRPPPPHPPGDLFLTGGRDESR